MVLKSQTRGPEAHQLIIGNIGALYAPAVPKVLHALGKAKGVFKRLKDKVQVCLWNEKAGRNVVKREVGGRLGHHPNR